MKVYSLNIQMLVPDFFDTDEALEQVLNRLSLSYLDPICPIIFTENESQVTLRAAKTIMIQEGQWDEETANEVLNTIVKLETKPRVVAVEPPVGFMKGIAQKLNEDYEKKKLESEVIDELFTGYIKEPETLTKPTLSDFGQVMLSKIEAEYVDNKPALLSDEVLDKIAKELFTIAVDDDSNDYDEYCDCDEYRNYFDDEDEF